MVNETVRGNVTNTTVRAHIETEKKNNIGIVSAMHYHDELELLPIYEGSFCCTVYDKEYVAKAGDIVFINSRDVTAAFRQTRTA